MEAKPGDWNCLSCDVLNFSSRDKCFKCNDWRPRQSDNADFRDNGRKGDWECYECHANNFGFRSECFKCGHYKGGKGGFNDNRGGFNDNRGGFRNNSRDFKDQRGGYQGGQRFSNPRQQPKKKPGDFFCSVCGELNFASRDTCRKCGKRKDRDLEQSNLDFKPGDWHCENCKAHNFASKKNCYKCSEPNPNKEEMDTWQDGDWKCFECGELNKKHEDECKGCHRYKNQRRKGDIDCPDCGKLNFSFRNQCIECGNPLENYSRKNRDRFQNDKFYDERERSRDRDRFSKFRFNGGGNNFSDSFKSGDWNCKNCGFHNYASRTQCKECGDYK